MYSPPAAQPDYMLMPVRNARLTLRLEEGASIAALQRVMGPGLTILREGEAIHRGALLPTDLLRLTEPLQIQVMPEQIYIPGAIYLPQDEHQLRGGGKLAQQNRTPWETSGASQGVKLAANITLDSKPLEQIASDNVHEAFVGYVFTTLAQWQTMDHNTRSTKLIAILPGKCAVAMKKCGVQEAHYKEMELLLVSPDISTPMRRLATVVNRGHGVLNFSLDCDEIKVTPKANTELVVEADPRWLAKDTLQQIQHNWKETAATLVTKMLGSTLGQDSLYAHRAPQGASLCYTAKMRLSEENALKILPASGQHAVFIRPSNIEFGAGPHGWTVVWSLFSAVPQAQLLSKVMSIAQAIPGHLGVARSHANLGLRIVWKEVAKARAQMRPADDRITEQNQGLHDRLKFRVNGVPAGTSPSELAQVFTSIHWEALPQRRIKAHNDSTEVWIASAEKAPAKEAYKWGAHYVIIEPVSEQDLKKAKATWMRKFVKEDTSSPSSTSHMDSEEQDKLYAKDPWAKMQKKRQMESSAESKVTQDRAAVAASVTSHSTASSSRDPRVDQLAQRVGILESQQEGLSRDVGKIEQKVEAVDGKLDNKFQEVLTILRQMHNPVQH